MNIKIFPFNPIQVNTYVLSDETKECVIIDPGCFYPDEKRELLSYILDNDLVIKHVLNTHLHFDHTLGLNFVYEQFQMRTEAHQADQFLLDMLPQQYEAFGFGKYDGEIPIIGKYLTEHDIISFGNQKLAIQHVPGHSPGSLVFYNNEYAFVGDVLFRGSIGRTDLIGGDMQLLLDGIRSKLFTLSPDTVVYSGHGPTTTIGEEAKNNPFF
ncbi:MBL fold metallo-hydrolase [Dysgonomonas sp. 25]|uniref:MBL fold metallo-hydrolase n=1 Tax=Dysgonomonas sp. 25 TaxID=2302933 RepID=UPI0013D3D5A5|nr:MBL fold metallo-hydrolase [Dysgonomonas sp. 25]NDV68869.1 MBL fold metallo-hydrolase [Dysgonomonas sp. 25]